MNKQVRNSMPLDTHAAVKTLVAAGASEELSEAIVVVVAQEVSLAAELPPSAADLAEMSDTEVINRIVKSGQPGNSALAEMQRRFSEASKRHGMYMLILTVVILIFTVVQACNVISGCSSVTTPRSSVPTNPRMDDTRPEDIFSRPPRPGDGMRVEHRGLTEYGPASVGLVGISTPVEYGQLEHFRNDSAAPPKSLVSASIEKRGTATVRLVDASVTQSVALQGPATASRPPSRRERSRSRLTPSRSPVPLAGGEGPITASSVNCNGPMFPGIRAENRPPGRRAFA